MASKSKSRGSSSSAPKAGGAPAEPRKARPPQKALPDTAPKLTAERVFASRRRDPIVQAFLHEEKLRGRVRRLTRDAWKAEFETFKTAPRS